MPHEWAGGYLLEVERIRGERSTTLVFLHQGLGCAAEWRDFPRALSAATGCSTLAYSRWGHGSSEPFTLPRPPTFLHDEAHGALREGGETAGDVILIGHSDGASIALLHATSGARVHAVVAIAPHVFVEQTALVAIAR